MYFLQNKITGELIDPRSNADCTVTPNDVCPGCDDWDEAMEHHSEADLIEGFVVVCFARWSNGEQEYGGLCVDEFFDSDGCFRGADENGIYPIFG